MSTAGPPPPATIDPPPVNTNPPPPPTTTTTTTTTAAVTTTTTTTTAIPVTTDPPVTTQPPATTQNPPTTTPPRTTEEHTTITTTTPPPRTTTSDPPRTTDPPETPPYTTQYVTTVSVITITTVVPHTTMISGTVTTVFETLTTTTQIATMIPDPHQSPPPPSHDWPNRSGHLQTWQIATIVIAVLALFSACASVVLLGWMRKKRKEDKNKGVLGIGLEPWDEKEKRGVSVDGAQHQHHLQHVHGGAGSSGDPQGYEGTMWQGGGPGAYGQHGQEGSGATYHSGYPEPHQRGYSSDLYAYDLSGGTAVSEADHHGLYGGLVMSPQQVAMPHGGTGYYKPSYDGYPEGAEYYSTTQPVQYPTPPNPSNTSPNHSSTSPNSASVPLRHGESRAMESADYVDGYGHGHTSVGVPSREAMGDYMDVNSQRESHDGTQDSATLGRLDSRRTGPGGVNLLWDDPSKDRGQDLGVRGPEGEGELNWKVELSRKSPQALLRGEGEVVSEDGKGKGRAS